MPRDSFPRTRSGMWRRFEADLSTAKTTFPKVRRYVVLANPMGLLIDVDKVFQLVSKTAVVKEKKKRPATIRAVYAENKQNHPAPRMLNECKIYGIFKSTAPNPFPRKATGQYFAAIKDKRD